MSKSEFVGARLHGFLAREAPVGVIVRRGPSSCYQIILWHTDTDQFEFGQWFHGTIYPQVCDLSPDGKLFLYFAAKHHIVDHSDPNSLYKWTVISRPPYLTALAFWPIHDHFWLGGGIFVDNNTVMLGADAKRTPETGSVPPNLKIVLSDWLKAKGRYKKRRAESGWIQIQEGQWKLGRYDPPAIHRRESAGSLYKLLQYQMDNHMHVEYRLLHILTSKKVKLEKVKWADFDQRGRIVFGRDGKLFAIPHGESIDEVVELADFNGQQIEHIVAPDWALSWDGVRDSE